MAASERKSSSSASIQPDVIKTTISEYLRTADIRSVTLTGKLSILNRTFFNSQNEAFWKKIILKEFASEFELKPGETHKQFVVRAGNFRRELQQNLALGNPNLPFLLREVITKKYDKLIQLFHHRNLSIDYCFADKYSTLLHYACSIGHAPSVIALLNFNPSLTSIGSAYQVRSIIRPGFHGELVTEYQWVGSRGLTVLMAAVDSGDYECVYTFLNTLSSIFQRKYPEHFRERMLRFVNFQQVSNNETALHRAAKAGVESIIQILVEAGARLDIEDGKGDLPIHVAKNDDCRALLEALMKESNHPIPPVRRGFCVIL